MLVHHSGIKSKEFFYSYLKLFLQSRISSIEEMRKIVENHFFNGILDEYGSFTKEQFKLACFTTN